MSRSAEFLLIAAISAVVLLGCKKERSFRGANPGDEIVFGGTAGSVSGFRSSKTKGGDGDSSVAGVLAGTGLDASEMESCGSYDSDADETYFFDWEDFEGGDGFGGSSADNEIHKGSSVVKACKGLSGSAGSESLSGGESSISCGGGISEAYSEDRAKGISSYGVSDAGNGLFGASDSDVQTKTEYSGDKNNVGGKTYERIDWKVGDKVKIFANGVKPPKTECVYEVSHVTASGIRSSAGLRPLNAPDGHGLLWDSGNADFYAFYPGNSPSKVFASNTVSNFDVTVKLPKEQNTFTKITSGNHTEVRPDMELAAMLAVSRNVPHASSVQLDFLPLVTTFRITIGNPSTTDDMTINKVSICYTSSASTPKSMSGNYKVSYTKVGGSTLSSHSVLAAHLTSGYAQEVSVNLGSVSGGPVLLPKKNGSTVSSMSVILFAVPVQHKGLQLKVNLAKGGVLEERILWLEKKQPVPPAPAEQLEFEPYKKYDINVGISKKVEYHLEVSSPSTGAPYNGGNLSGGWVRSYKTDGVTTTPASWWVEGYSESGPTGHFTATKPTWLTNFTPYGNGVASSSETEPVTANVSAQPHITIPNARTTALRGKSEVGESNPIDLSRVPVGNSPFFSIPDGHNGSHYTSNPMNTANCYVVTRPGWYKIPVVYGNAFKEGNVNIGAYKPNKLSGLDETFLTPFISHDGQAIDKPWIKENSGINLDDGVAELLWQDQPNLVKDIQLESNKKFIVFHVSQSTIHEGNAVIALKASSYGEIVWSWHIWVYGGDNLKTIKVKNNKDKAPSRPGKDNFDFLSENLGACYDGVEIVTFPAGNVWVKISNGRKTEVIKITRLAGPATTSFGYNNPYYQWGRKDPMLPSSAVGNTNKYWYDKDGERKNNLPTTWWQSNGDADQAKAEIANTIKQPQTFNKSYGMDNLYYNLWDTRCNETGISSVLNQAVFESVTKSVYDPCPPGFCLPPDGAFTGFTITGTLSFTLSEFNVYASFNDGWNFRTALKNEPYSGAIFFPASGDRSSTDGFLGSVGSCGDYWSGIPYPTGSGGFLNFSSNRVVPLSNSNRSSGYVLRPVAEN